MVGVVGCGAAIEVVVVVGNISSRAIVIVFEVKRTFRSMEILFLLCQKMR